MYTAQETAKKIKETAKQKGIKIKNMLSTCDLGINAISEMAKGKTMSFTKLAKIADYLEVTTDYLLGREDKANHSGNQKNTSAAIKFSYAIIHKDGKGQEHKVKELTEEDFKMIDNILKTIEERHKNDLK